MKFDSIFEPHVVLRFFVTNKSFCAIGIPDKARSEDLLSRAFAFSIAFSLFKVINAFNLSYFSTKLKVSSISS